MKVITTSLLITLTLSRDLAFFPSSDSVPMLSIPSNIFHSLRTSESQRGHWGLLDYILLEVPQDTLQHKGH